MRRHLVTPSSRRLHLAKTVTWRLVATTTTIPITWIVTGDLLVGAAVGGIESTSKMIVYYGHERARTRLLSDRTPTAHAPDRT